MVEEVVVLRALKGDEGAADVEGGYSTGGIENYPTEYTFLLLRWCGRCRLRRETLFSDKNMYRVVSDGSKSRFNEV